MITCLRRLEMADESLFDFLHMEIVSQVYKHSSKGEMDNKVSSVSIYNIHDMTGLQDTLYQDKRALYKVTFKIICWNSFLGSSCLCFGPRGDGLPSGTRTHWEVVKHWHPVSAKWNTWLFTTTSFNWLWWRYALCRLTRDSPSFKDELDIMKFICKDFWTKVFRRQVDNLRTNHQVKQVGW